ncbi:hypothetical protein X975_23497, partial [Stegodyphus mimosarum]
MTTQLEIVDRFCRDYGLHLNVKKCHSLHLVRQRDHTVLNTSTSWVVNGVPIPSVLAEEIFRYLRIDFSPLRGLSHLPS